MALWLNSIAGLYIESLCFNQRYTEILSDGYVKEFVVKLSIANL